MTYVLELAGVSRIFPTQPPVTALAGIDLRVPRGDYVGIVGPSGSGKSTLLNVLGLLDVPNAGRYLLEGVETTTMSDRQRTEVRGSRIGFVFQSFHLLMYRTVLENVMLGGLYTGVPAAARRRQAVTALDRVGMGHRQDFLPSRLSGGERQRAAIARALLGDPALLLCDEPTGNLDSANTAAVLDLFDELRAGGATLLVITHDLAVAARAGRQVRISDGRLTLLDEARR
ncbi:ABC transporter ATP-binding protein [Catenuloplanes sp. NPDC051500]|uniref:ABC transporter ATP-binding protein n=1 Tax=Catenuloplanes sp. NPDC051500 TaxID=3363959 RepID=UPI0037A1AEF3